MSNLISELERLIEEEKSKKKVGRPRKEDVQRSGAGEGLPEDWTRYTVIIRKETLENLKDYAWYERITIKEAFERAVSGFLEQSDYRRK